MHAYLLVGQGITNYHREAGYSLPITNLAMKLKAKILEFPLAKIEDTRELNSFTSLKVAEPTAILINSIDEATNEALNAFLKNLEEPQENLYYILTASSVKKVLPTIVSRCQIVRIKNYELGIKNAEIEKFMKMTVGEKLAYVDKIKDREEAKKFVEELILLTHDTLQADVSNYLNTGKNLKIENATRLNLKANGNVSLQLTNMVINLL